MVMIYKILPAPLWDEAVREGSFTGASLDLQDGYIHFSSREQVAETAARHFAGQAGLLLVAVEGDRLGAALRWEPARGGDLFPHLYGALDTGLVEWDEPMPLGPDGVHILPARFSW